MRKIYFNLILLIISFQVHAQDSLLRSISDSLSASRGKEYVSGTFKALYIVNMKTIEAPAAGALNFEIQHRFGPLTRALIIYGVWISPLSVWDSIMESATACLWELAEVLYWKLSTVM
jgi:hypothetical protein